MMRASPATLSLAALLSASAISPVFADPGDADIRVVPAPSQSDIANWTGNAPTVADAKIEALKSVGMQVGAQGGLIERARAIAKSLGERETDLDRAFPFQPLLDENGLLPPVIEETDQTVETKSAAQRLEFAGKTYRIVSPAHFVRVAPTWRDYLYNGLATDKLSVDRLPEALRPANSAEREIWSRAVAEGWRVGEEQADDILAANTARLRRDYLGMVKYQILLQRGMIRKPVLSSSPESVRVTDDEISVGVGVMEVAKKASMEPDQSEWGERNPYGQPRRQARANGGAE